MLVLNTLLQDDFVEHMPSPSIEDHGFQNEYNFDQVVKDEVKSTFTINQDTSEKCKANNPAVLTFALNKDKMQPFLAIKIKEESKSEDEDISIDVVQNCIKPEYKDIRTESKSELSSFITIKTEPNSSRSETSEIARKPIKIEDIVEKGTVEIVDQNEQDLEADDFSSPIATMESDAELKKRVAELRLEFGGAIAALSNFDSEIEKSFENQTEAVQVKCEEHNSIDEFDVEAQMKKITGDDGDDYKEKVDTSSEKDKSMDGIEGLMESSKEDSESDFDHRTFEQSKGHKKNFEKSKFFDNGEERVFKEFECKNRDLPIEKEFEMIRQSVVLIEEDMKTQMEQSNLTDKESLDSIERELERARNVSTKQSDHLADNKSLNEDCKSTSIITPEESMMELDSMELPSEDLPDESAKVFPSIPPLSERIRKKVDFNPIPKSRLEIEASIIESSLDLENVGDAENGEEKKMLSTALRELLEAKIEPDEKPILKIVNKNLVENKISDKPHIKPVEEALIEETRKPSTTSLPIVEQFNKEIVSIVTTEKASHPESKRLKDPRTVVPNKMPVPSPPKVEGPPPIKRKVNSMLSSNSKMKI